MQSKLATNFSFEIRHNQGGLYYVFCSILSNPLLLPSFLRCSSHPIPEVCIPITSWNTERLCLSHLTLTLNNPASQETKV